MTAEFNSDRTVVTVRQHIKNVDFPEEKIVHTLVPWTKKNINEIYAVLKRKYDTGFNMRFKLTLYDIHMKLNNGYYAVSNHSLNKEQREVEFVIKLM